MPVLRTFSLHIFPKRALLMICETLTVFFYHNKLQCGLCLCHCHVCPVFRCLVDSDVWWDSIHSICYSFIQIVYSSDLCEEYLVLYTHPEERICEGLNPEMFEVMQWPHLF
jgi:hypothetical protein